LKFSQIAISGRCHDISGTKQHKTIGCSFNKKPSIAKKEEKKQRELAIIGCTSGSACS
jgi:hypothetical protein